MLWVHHYILVEMCCEINRHTGLISTHRSLLSFFREEGEYKSLQCFVLFFGLFVCCFSSAKCHFQASADRRRWPDCVLSEAETQQEEGKGLVRGFTCVYRLVSVVSTVRDKSRGKRAESVLSLSFLDGSHCCGETEQKTEQVDMSEHTHIETGEKNYLWHPILWLQRLCGRFIYHFDIKYIMFNVFS